MRLISAAILAFSLSFSTASSAETALKMVEHLYAPYLSPENAEKQFPDTLSPDLYTRRVGKILAALKKACNNSQEQCGPEFDYLVNAQDYQLSDFKAEETKSEANSATVTVSFKNMDRPTVITFSMKKGDRGWVIDDVVSPPMGDSPGYSLADVLQP